MTTFVVNSVSDVNDGNLNNGITTLREAIDAANQIAGDDSITFDFGGTAQTIKLTSALPIINSNIDIKGTSKDTLTISSEHQYRVFFVYAGAVGISGLTIANGYAKGGDGGSGIGGGGGTGAGGGLFVNSGSVVIDSVIFSSNQAIGGKGGDAQAYFGGGGGGGFRDNGGDSRSGSGGQGGGSGLESLLGGSSGSGGQRVAAYPVPAGYDYAVTNGQSGTLGTGGGGGGNTEGYLLRPDFASAAKHGLGGNGGDFSGGGGGGGNGGFGGGGGGSNGSAGDWGGKGGKAGSSSGVFLDRAGAGSRAVGGPTSGGGGGAGLGGAIFINNFGSLTLSNVKFEENSARGGQGGYGVITNVYHAPGTPFDVSGEVGKGKGGAIYVRSGGTLKIVKNTSVFSSNDASDNDPNLLEQDNENIFGSYTLIAAPTIVAPPQGTNLPVGTGENTTSPGGIASPPGGSVVGRITEKNDYISGTPGADRLLGLGGNDRIIGGDGNDFLDGGKGKDTLSGGKGKDKFLLGQGLGRDLIQDFQDKQDKLVLAGKLKFKDLDILQRGKGTLVSAGKEQLAFLKNVDADLITAADFTRSLQ